MKFKTFAAATALALCAQASFAQDNPPPIPLVFSASGANTLTTSFQGAVNGMFVDTFTFTPSAFDGEVFVSLQATQGPVNFFSAILNGEGFSFDPDQGKATFDFRSMVSANTPLMLTVLGFSGALDTLTAAPGIYSLTVNAEVAAIPEPGTYALMLAGLALVAGMARRSRRVSSAGH